MRTPMLPAHRRNNMTSRMAARIVVIALLLSPLAAKAAPKDKDDDFPFLEATVAQIHRLEEAGCEIGGSATG